MFVVVVVGRRYGGRVLEEYDRRRERPVERKRKIGIERIRTLCRLPIATGVCVCERVRG